MASPLRPCQRVRVGRLIVPIRMTFGAIADIQRLTGVDLLSGHGVLGVQDRRLPHVLHRLAVDATGDEAPSLAMIRLSLLPLSKRARAGIWMSLAVALMADMPLAPESPTPADEEPTIRAEERTEALWIACRVRMGLSLAEFQACTPREITLIGRRATERERAEQQSNDYRFALITSFYLNAHRREEDEPVGMADLFPSLRPLLQGDEVAEGGHPADVDRPAGAPTFAELARVAREGLRDMRLE